MANKKRVQNIKEDPNKKPKKDEETNNSGVLNDRQKQADHWDTAPIYETFPVISKAVEFSEKNGGLPLFALDKPDNPDKKNQRKGAKLFIVASYCMLWKMFLKCKPEDRCFYETLVPFRACHLHIDAEYLRLLNPNSDEEWLHKTTLQEIKDFLIELGYVTDPDRELDTMTLDSSNDRKVSKHYIVKIKGKRFKNNYHCGAFMRRLRNRLMKKYGEDTTKNPFFLWGEKKREEDQNNPLKNLECFIDLGIYTCRRQWRVYKATKRGGYRPLVLEGEDNKDTKVNRETFFAAFVQRIADYKEIYQIIECMEEDGTEPQSTSNKLSYRPDVQSKKMDGAVDRVQSAVYGRKSNWGDGKRPDSKPIPQVAHDIANAIEDEWRDGSSSKPIWFIGNTIGFDSTSKLCRVKGSEHGGNHIWYKAYLNRGTFVQGCFCSKSSCRTETGEVLVTEEIELPTKVKNKINKYMEEEQKTQEANELLINGFMKVLSFHSKSSPSGRQSSK